MTEEDQRIVSFIREREPCCGWSDEQIYHAYRDTLFYARVRLAIAVNDFKDAVRGIFQC